MRFRPCIDIHNGKVKQIVGGSLQDEGNQAKVNFTSDKDAAWYANLYKRDGLSGGHMILLNKAGSAEYEQDLRQALPALSCFKGACQIGGGICAKNASLFLNAGASHVIVTSYVFQNGRINWEHLRQISKAAGKEHLVLDLSCRRKGKDYYIVTDRWQNFTEVILTEAVFEQLAPYCDEFLIHAVDAEGKAAGVEDPVLELLGRLKGLTVTYAGGIHSMEDIEKIRRLGNGRVDFTVGSALDLFGGPLPYDILKTFR